MLHNVKTTTDIALYIRETMPEYDFDDIYDILLGNINTPIDMVNDVYRLSAEYEEKKRSALQSAKC